MKSKSASTPMLTMAQPFRVVPPVLGARTGRGSADHPAALQIYRRRGDRQEPGWDSSGNLSSQSNDREYIDFPACADCAHDAESDHSRPADSDGHLLFGIVADEL